MKRRICAGLLAVLLLLSMTACGETAQSVTPEQLEQAAQTVQDVLLALDDAGEAAASENAAQETADAPDAAPAEEATVGEAQDDAPQQAADAALDESGSYTSKGDVALYIHLYGHLPDNFITKKEAQQLGWEGGSLEPYAPGKCIGGSHFGNYEGILPEKEGRSYTECDIDTLGADKRGAKRIVFSNDGLIYYTEDHYETFDLLYGEES